MKCIVCNKEFSGREGAKCCSSTCRSKASRAQNATDNEISVAKPQTPEPSESPKTRGLDKTDYYHSEEYLNLIKHLEETPLEALRKEGIFIPVWKLNGLNKMSNLKELLK